MKTTDTLWTTVVGGFFSMFAYLVGGVDDLVKALGIIMFIDFALGISVAFVVRKDVNSKRAFVGLLRKTGMVSIVIAMVQIDNVTGSGDFLRNTAIMMIIGMEGISFVENLGLLGVKVPRFVREAFTQLQSDNENAELPQQTIDNIDKLKNKRKED